MSPEPVAIVGMACRFPGAPDIDSFRRLLERGEHAITNGEPGSGVGRIGRILDETAAQIDACRYAALIDGIDRFDPAFFRISPVEARALDPQQRLMLETSWEALEDAGIDPEGLRGSRTGIFGAVISVDYRSMIMASEPSLLVEPMKAYFAVSGNAYNTAVGRVSYALGLHGPALALDTACSGSLVAMHEAVTTLQGDEADLMLVSGVHAILGGWGFALRATAGMLSPDGRCATFDAAANGFVRGEGCGVIVLKRLADAIADGDRIWAVVRGSAVNQDGESPGLAVPNGRAQELLVAEALRRANLTPADVDYVEAHGTGTAVGDPIELRSLANSYGQYRTADRPLLIGSVKTNVGHLESAAGLAGVMKVALAMQRGEIQPHLNFRDPTPHFDWDTGNLQVTDTATPWQPHPDQPRRAGVSGFGWSGTNAHVLLESYGSANGSTPTGVPRAIRVHLPESPVAPRRRRVLPLSGKTPTALRELAGRYLQRLDEEDVSDAAALADLAWTAGVGRSHFSQRAGVVFDDADSLRAALERIVAAEEGAAGGGAGGTDRTVGFVYTGMGSDWVGMGADLYDTEPVVRAVLDRCEELVIAQRGESLLDVMFGRTVAPEPIAAAARAAEVLNDPYWSQPAIYALECALTELWASLGIRPHAVLGNSLGEVAAAYAAGVYSLSDGLAHALARGELASRRTAPGAMAAVFVPAERVDAEVASFNADSDGPGISVSGYNGGAQVISGRPGDIAEITKRFAAERVWVQPVAVTRAFHSALMEPMLDDMEAAAAGLALGTPTCTMVSSLEGRALRDDETMDGTYWRRQLRQPVAFRDGTEALANLGVDVVVEVGPRPLLKSLVLMSWPDSAPSAPTYAPSLAGPAKGNPRATQSDTAGAAGRSRGGFVEAVAALYEAGVPLCFEGLYAGETRRRRALPTYPFQRNRYWVGTEKRPTLDVHPLLGTRHESPRGEMLFSGVLSAKDPDWLSDHQVFGRVLIPAALYKSLALAAAWAPGAGGTGGGAMVEDLQLYSPLVVPDFDPDDLEEAEAEPSRAVQVLVGGSNGTGPRRLEIFSRGPGEVDWTLHAEAQVSPLSKSSPEPAASVRQSVSQSVSQSVEAVDLDGLTDRLEREDVAEFYRSRAQSSIVLGRRFRPMQALWVAVEGRDGEAVGELLLPDGVDLAGIEAHPILIDGCMQVTAAARMRSSSSTEGVAYLPFGCERFWLSSTLPERVVCHARVRARAAAEPAEPTDRAESAVGAVGADRADGTEPVDGSDGATGDGRADTHVAGDDQPEIAVADAWFYDPDGNPIGALIGYTFKRATRAAFLSAADDVRELLYEIAWRDRPLAPAMPAADFLVDPGDIVGTISHFSTYVEAQGVDDAERISCRDDAEQMARYSVLATLERLGWERTAGEVVDPETLRRQLGVIDERRNQFRQLFTILAGAGVVAPQGDGFVTLVGAADPLPDELVLDPVEFYAAMRERYAFAWVEIGLLERCGGALADSLRGLADPLNLLFGSGDPSATDYYLKAPATLAANEVVADVVAGLIAELPEDRRLRVLEIGAGTGASTEAILRRLPEEMFDYTYTDISAGFFPDAEDRLGGADAGISYKVLDIEVSPLEQGFAAHSYDLVVAGNVLHATRYLDRTLAHCAELLAPSGALVLLEPFSGGAWLDLTFGQLDGWWLFDDKYRSYVLASADTWREVLADVGFGEVGILEYGDDSGSSRGVIMARGPAEVSEPPGLWVIAADTSGVAEQLAAELVERNQTVLLARHAATAPAGSSDPPAAGDDPPEVEPGVESSDWAGTGEPSVAVAPSDPPGGAAGEGPGIFERSVDMGSREAWRALLASLADGVPLAGVVHMPALDGASAVATTGELAAALERITGSALAMLQGAMDADVAPTRGLSYLTAGAQGIERERGGQLAGATLSGFVKVALLEVPDMAPRHVDLDPAEVVSTLGELTEQLLHPDVNQHIALRDGNRKVARVIRLGTRPDRLALPQGSDWHLEPGEAPASLLARRTPRRSPAPDEVRVAIDGAGINFLDVVRTMGVITEGELGREFVGRIVEVGSEVTAFAPGDRVVGMGWNCFAPETVLSEVLVAPAPEGVPPAALATLPTAFVTAAWSFDVAGLGAGDRVLIHAASGGVGLAAIQLAQAAGAEVFATASAPKQAYLRSLGLTNVYDSRSTDFAGEILAATDGAGVDVVLNSLTSEGFIDASLSALATGGRFIELAKNNIRTPEQVAAERPDVAYSIVDLDTEKRRAPAQVGAVLGRIMARYAAGELTPLAHTRWSLNEAPAALRHMRETRHIGKLVLTAPPLRDGKLRRDRSYLVTGGLGGIGIALADWLAEHGAGTIILNGRRAPDPAAVEAIAALRERGTKVVVELADVTDSDALDAMLARIAAAQQPLGGVIHSVGVLDDAAISTQTWERFRTVLWPKVLGAWHLHRATEHLDLDMFVLFSSAAGVTGNAGQANHAAANTFLDQLAAHRRAIGLPGVVIAWGAWSGLGEAEEQRRRLEKLFEASGTNWITPGQGLRAMELLFSQDVMASMATSVDWARFMAGFESAAVLLEEVASAVTGDGEVAYAGGNPLAGIAEATFAAREQMLVTFLAAELRMVMQLSGEVPTTVEFTDLGMDSLMAVALRNRLNRALDGLYVAPNAVVFEHPTIARLATHVAEQLGDVIAGDTAAAGAPSDAAAVGSAAAAPAGSAGPDAAALSAGPAALSEAAAPEAAVSAEGAAVSGAAGRLRATATNGERAGQGVAAGEAVAIVGMACRFPGAPDVAAFWQQLADGTHAVTDSRTDPGPWTGIAGDPAASANGDQRAGFIEGMDRFDAGFFRMTPAIARRTDPQQRLLLETAWHALEDAGIDPESLRGTRTGVYSGINVSEYAQLLFLYTGEAHFFGTSHSAAVGRISHTLGLAGPTVPLDLACASALVAVHQAVSDLRRGDVDMALAGGVNVVLQNYQAKSLKLFGWVARSGATRSFDADADGYMRGEGCGLFVLKRLDDATAEGDRIWGVIRGSAVNQSAASGLGQPSRPMQERVMAEALERAGVAPGDLDYLEAHGTATEMGDAIELEAAGAVYGQGRARSRPLLIGSVKTNVGHLETAAAAAGLAKAVLAMNQRHLPAHLHFETPNPEIAAQQLPVEVTAQAAPWPETPGRLPLAAVNSFGLSGANAHVVLEGHANGASAVAASNGQEAGAVGAGAAGANGARAGRLVWPAGAPKRVVANLPAGVGELVGPASDGNPPPVRARRMLALSGKSAKAVRTLAESYLTWLDEHAGFQRVAAAPGSAAENATDVSDVSDVSGAAADSLLADMAFTAGIGRSHFRHRAAVLFDDLVSLRAALAEIASGERPSAERGSDSGGSAPGPLALAFGPAAPEPPSPAVTSLYETEPVVRAIVDHCNELWASEATEDAADTADGAAVSLLDVLLGRRSADDVPAVGDDTAAPGVHAAATYAWQCALAALWASVGVRPDVVAGTGAGQIAAAHAAGILSLDDGARLATAFGSDDPAADLAAAAEGIEFSPPSCTFVGAGGEIVRRREPVDAAAWLSRLSANEASDGSADPADLGNSGASATNVGDRGDNHRGDGPQALAALGVTAILEVGPDGLRGPVALGGESESSAEPTTPDTPAGADRGGFAGFVEAVARAYEAGFGLSFEGLFVGEQRRRLSVPVYPFQRRSFWLPTVKPAVIGASAEALL